MIVSARGYGDQVQNAALRSKSKVHPTCPSPAADSKSFVIRGIRFRSYGLVCMQTETCHEGCRSSRDPVVGMTVPSQVFWQEKEGWR